MSYVLANRRRVRRPMAMGLVKSVAQAEGETGPASSVPDLLTGTTGYVRSGATAGEAAGNLSPGTVAAAAQDAAAQATCTAAGGTYQIDANIPCMSACETSMRQQCAAAGGVFTLGNRTMLNPAKGQYFMSAICQTPTGALQLVCAPLNSASSCAGQGGSYIAATGECGVVKPAAGSAPGGAVVAGPAIAAGPSLMTMLLLGVAGVAAVVYLKKRKAARAPVPVPA